MTDRRRPLHGTLARSLADVVIGEPEAFLERESSLDALRADDMVQLHQVPVSGTASSTVASGEMNVVFQNAFTQNIDPTNSDYGLENPSFAYGVEMTTGPAGVFVDVQVRSWTINNQGWIVGARIRISAWSPGAGGDFEGVAHLWFCGYGSPAAEES